MVTLEQNYSWSQQMWEKHVWPFMVSEFGAREYNFLYTGYRSKEDMRDKIDVLIYEITLPDKKWKFQIRIQDKDYRSFTIRKSRPFGNDLLHEYHLILNTDQPLFDIFLQAYVVKGVLTSIAAIRIEYLRYLKKTKPKLFEMTKTNGQDGVLFAPVYWYMIPPNSHFYVRKLSEPKSSKNMDLFK